MAEEPQSAGQALYYLLTYAYAWGLQDAKDHANNIKKTPTKRELNPYREPSDPALASLIHTIRIRTMLPGALDKDALRQAIETLRSVGIDVSGHPHSQEE
jgi:hypothetical protein